MSLGLLCLMWPASASGDDGCPPGHSCIELPSECQPGNLPPQMVVVHGSDVRAEMLRAAIGLLTLEKALDKMGTPRCRRAIFVGFSLWAPTVGGAPNNRDDLEPGMGGRFRIGFRTRPWLPSLLVLEIALDVGMGGGLDAERNNNPQEGGLTTMALDLDFRVMLRALSRVQPMLIFGGGMASLSVVDPLQQAVGLGPTFHVGVGLQLWASKRIAFVLRAGYRHSQIALDWRDPDGLLTKRGWRGIHSLDTAVGVSFYL
jgi:hypothetical protein